MDFKVKEIFELDGFPVHCWSLEPISEAGKEFFEEKVAIGAKSANFFVEKPANFHRAIREILQEGLEIFHEG